MLGILGKKVGMTTIYNDNGTASSCTVIYGGPCQVVQLKTIEKDGYAAVQIGYEDKKNKHTSKPLLGHFQKAKVTPKRKLVEFKLRESTEPVDDISIGQTVNMQDIFSEGDYIDVTGISKGKGFQGVVKRHGFSGVGERTHGQHNRNRAPGSIGASSYPSRVFKGMRMAGRTGGNKVKSQNLKVLKLLSEDNLIIVKGSVPGPKGSFLKLEK